MITEGNYLLVPDEPWAAVRPLLDEAWYVDPGEETRLDWRVQRHVAHGRAPEAALAWALGTGPAQAELIATTRGRADLVLAPPPLSAA